MSKLHIDDNIHLKDTRLNSMVDFFIGIEGRRMLVELESGYRMDKPTEAPDFIGDMLKRCWEREPANRPTFNQLENTLAKYVHSSAKSFYL